MSKTNHITIGKTQYEIETDAENSLKRYLAELRGAFNAETAKETMADIELHITEIFTARGIHAGSVISTKDVLAIKEQLGDPDEVREEFDDNDAPKPKSKRFVWLAIVGAILVTMGASTLIWRDYIFPGKVMNETQHHTYNRTIKSLKAVFESGDVTLRTGKTNEVVVERHLKWTGDKPTFTETWNDEELNIRTDCPEEQRNCSIEYVIYTPNDISADFRIDAGNIDVEDIAGKLRLETSAGNVDVTGSKESVWSRVSDGNITVSGNSSETDLQTNSGSINLNFRTAPTQVKATTSAGNVEIVVPFGDTYTVRAETSSGQRVVAVQQATDATRQIDAKTSSGNVTIQYPQN